MSQTIKASELPEFDAAEHLKDQADIAEYLRLIIEEGDASELARALGTVARARGMTQIAAEAGLGRESLYKALREQAQPRYETVQRVLRALDLELTVRAVDDRRR